MYDDTLDDYFAEMDKKLNECPYLPVLVGMILSGLVDTVRVIEE